MMSANLKRFQVLILALLFLFGCATIVPGQQGGDLQQYYSPSNSWLSHPSGLYRYKKYNYETAPNKWSLHYVIHRPGESYVYYYNPYKEVYWCRALVNQAGQGKKIWFVLPNDQKKRNLPDIPEHIWKNCLPSHPFLPGTNGPTRMLPPPNPPVGPIR